MAFERMKTYLMKDLRRTLLSIMVIMNLLKMGLYILMELKTSGDYVRADWLSLEDLTNKLF